MPEVGARTEIGQCVLLNAEEAPEPDIGHVTTLLQLMVVQTVMETKQNLRVVTKVLVQSMEAGVYTHHGRLAQLIVEEAPEPELGCVTIPRLLTEVYIVQDSLLNCRLIATIIHAQ